MRLTKYPQSCLVVDHDDGGRLLIDPGNVAMDAYSLDDFGALDAVLFTHRHPDHCDPRALDAIRERAIVMHGNADVCEVIGEGITQVDDGQRFIAAGIDIVAHDMPHVTMINGAAGPPNTGFVLDGRILHPGDAVQAGGIRVDALAVPIAGPSVSLRDAYVMVQETGARTAVPIHYDVFPADPYRFMKACDVATVVVLGHGEHADV